MGRNVAPLLWLLVFVFLVFFGGSGCWKALRSSLSFLFCRGVRFCLCLVSTLYLLFVRQR